MYAKFKTIVSPGLVNLIMLELAFLLLALYIGFVLWTGIPPVSNFPGMEVVFGLILFITLYRKKL